MQFDHKQTAAGQCKFTWTDFVRISSRSMSGRTLTFNRVCPEHPSLLLQGNFLTAGWCQLNSLQGCVGGEVSNLAVKGSISLSHSEVTVLYSLHTVCLCISGIIVR